ncbi:EpsG family protein [Vibrio scophthalmi]|uniref:EpsG family protein n=1 Tax=Vibrio scophthalmi TaxID=45658 RepID=UPI003B978C9F
MTYLIFSLYTLLCLVVIPRYMKSAFLFFISIGLIFFSGLRYESGIDYFNYLNLYNASYYASTEYLYWFISIIHKNTLNSFPLFIFMISFVSIAIKLYVLDRSSENVFVSVFVFICISYIYVDMGFIRNSISLSFFMLSFLMYSKDDKWYAFFFFFVSFLFHHSVIFMAYLFLLRPSSKGQVSQLYLVLLLACMLIACFDLPREILALSESLSFLPHYITWKLNFYLNNVQYENLGINIYNVRYFILSLFFYYFQGVIKKSFLIKLYILGSCLILLLGFNVQFYSRVGIYTAFFEVLLISGFSYHFTGKNRLLFMFFLTIFYGVLFSRTSYIMGINSVVIL